MIAASAKVRYEIQGDRIRALYGHSVPGKLKRTPAAPPGTLYHGTSAVAWVAIQREGLRPMGRQYVHLSVEPQTAEQVGRRRCAQPIVLSIAAGEAYAAGVSFYEGNEQVWLADAIPPEFTRF